MHRKNPLITFLLLEFGDGEASWQTNRRSLKLRTLKFFKVKNLLLLLIGLIELLIWKFLLLNVLSTLISEVEKKKS